MEIPATEAADDRSTALVRRVNQLYHELTQDSFDADHRRRHRVERPFWEAVARLIPPRTERNAGRGWMVVDLACGTGFVAATLGPRLRSGDRLIAIDLSPAALGSTAGKWSAVVSGARPGPRLERLTADGSALPLPTGSVDLLALNAALHHMPAPEAVIREVDRVLRPGGWFALGFEPNAAHFASRPIAGLARSVDRLAWYASLRENRRRLRTWLGYGTANGMTGGDGCAVIDRINRELLGCGLVPGRLSSSEILDLVDPHARGAGRAGGFDAPGLLRRLLPGYQVRRFFSCDYLGEAGRSVAAVRGLVDAVFRAALPGHGSLFSWIVRKPLTDAERVKGGPLGDGGREE